MFFNSILLVDCVRNKRCFKCGVKITYDNLSRELSEGHPNSGGEFYRRFWCKECEPRI